MRPAEQKNDPWHIYDIAFYTETLLMVGVKQSDIFYFIDYPDEKLIQEAFGSFNVPVPTVIYSFSDYELVLNQNLYDNVAIFITGHGGIDGFDTQKPLKPYVFYEILKKAPNLKQAVIYFGQCDAGIYNYISLDTAKNGHNGSKIVAIGAAGLHSSLSSSKITDNLWAANVFLGFVFHWISNPVDIDGDNHFSVMDSYKYATIKTAAVCKEIENEELTRSANFRTQLAYLYDKLKDKKDLSLDEELQIKSLREKISQNDYNQTPWILNALPALEIDF